MSPEDHPNQDSPNPPSQAPLATQESFLRQVLDINPNLIFAKDRKGRFTLVNKTIADIYGTTVEQLMGRTDADFNRDPEQVDFFRRIDLQVMDSRKELFIPEEVLTDSAGNRHWLQTVKRPIIGPDGVANQVLGVATDITHRRELEEQLRRAQKMEAIGTLAGGIAHDFNNMLAVILGNTERLLKIHSRQTNPDASLLNGLELIESAGRRAGELVGQLLTVSRKQPVSPIVVNLGAVVESLRSLLKTAIGDQIELTIEPHDQAIRTRIDRGHLEQLIVNLVVNARDAMPSGGRVTIATAPVDRAECPSGAQEGDCVMLSVSDSGTGIPPELLDRIFEPFFTTKPAKRGTGLGLSIAYGVVQQAGGQILVESVVDQGTTFRVYLPTVNDPLTPRAESSSGQTSQGCETILVCEDQENVLQLLCGTLSDHGYRVLSAGSGAEAVRTAREFSGRIDLLMTDVVMPGMSGRHLVDAVLKDRPTVPVLFITGYPANVLGSLDDLGTKHSILMKPFQSAALLRELRSLLNA